MACLRKTGYDGRVHIWILRDFTSLVTCRMVWSYKHGILLRVVVQRKQLCLDGKKVKQKTFVMSSLTSRSKQRRQGLAAILWSVRWSQVTVTWIEHKQRWLLEGVEFRDIVSAFSCTNSFIAQKCPLVFKVTMSCDCHRVIPNNTASVVVVLVPMYGECWLAYLLTVYNCGIATFLLARGGEPRS